MQAKTKDFQERLEFKCFDCNGQSRHDGKWDCKMTNCPFYEIRPRSIYFGKPIPEKFRHSVFDARDIKPEKH